MNPLTNNLSIIEQTAFNNLLHQYRLTAVLASSEQIQHLNGWKIREIQAEEKLWAFINMAVGQQKAKARKLRAKLKS